MNSTPYIVLLGDVGSGKSTLVEKLAEVKSRSSAANQSETRTAEVFESKNGKLLICDTPGSNSMTEQFKHNLHIAHALNFEPVSCILIVVKADARIDNVIANITKYALGLIPDDLPIELMGVCVTHMDAVLWTTSDILRHMKKELGIESAVFSSVNTTGEILEENLLAECENRQPAVLSIDGEIFLRLFQLSRRDSKVLYEARREVGRFQKMKQDFDRKMDGCAGQEKFNLVFEFHAYIEDEIVEAQRRLSSNNNFSYTEGPEMASEAGHIANMTYNLRKVIREVSAAAEEYVSQTQEYRVDLRQCPYCSAVWENTEGCSDAKSCGGLPIKTEQILGNGSKDMATYQFTWDTACEKLLIKLLPDVHAKKQFVCGNEVVWARMKPVGKQLKAEYDSILTPKTGLSIIKLKRPQDEIATHEDNNTFIAEKQPEQAGVSSTFETGQIGVRARHRSKPQNENEQVVVDIREARTKVDVNMEKSHSKCPCNCVLL